MDACMTMKQPGSAQQEFSTRAALKLDAMGQRIRAWEDNPDPTAYDNLLKQVMRDVKNTDTFHEFYNPNKIRFLYGDHGAAHTELKLVVNPVALEKMSVRSRVRIGALYLASAPSASTREAANERLKKYVSAEDFVKMTKRAKHYRRQMNIHREAMDKWTPETAKPRVARPVL